MGCRADRCLDAKGLGPWHWLAPLTSMSAKAKRARSETGGAASGLDIKDAKQFYKSVGNKLTNSLGCQFLTHKASQVGTREIAHIQERNPALLPGSEGPLPALEIYSDERLTAWIVIELESESGKPVVLQHVSLKLWQGVTTEAARLCFRAEWDVRDPESKHAQPHWNVHAPHQSTSNAVDEGNFAAFAELERETAPDSFIGFMREASAGGDGHPPKVAADRKHGLSADQLHHFISLWPPTGMTRMARSVQKSALPAKWFTGSIPARDTSNSNSPL